MKKIRLSRVTAVFLTLLVLAVLLPNTAKAVEATENRNVYSQTDHSYDEALRQALIDGVEDVTDDKYGLTRDTYGKKFGYLLYSDPNIIGIYDVVWTYYLRYDNSTVTKSYTLLYAENYQEIRAAFAGRLAQTIAEVRALLPENATDFQKALVAHDYLVATTAYDKDAVDREYDGEALKLHWWIYDAFGPIVNHTAVCKGYSLAYKAIMDALGVECLVTSSSKANHSWNIVRIDGEWYHVDCSADEYVYDMLGYVSHEAFCLSTETYAPAGSARADFIVAGDDYNLVFTDETCATSKKYEESTEPWKTSQGACHYYNGSLYTLSRSYVLQKDGEDFFMPQESMRWYPQSFQTANYINTMCRISGFGNTIYMTSPRNVYKINLDTGNAEIIFTPDTTNGLIFGLARIEGKLYCAVDAEAGATNETWIYIPGEDVTYELEEPQEEPKEPEKPDARDYANQKSVTLTAGEQVTLTDESGDYSGKADFGFLNSTIATVSVSGKTTPTIPAVPASVTKMTNFAAGNYRIGYQNGNTMTYLVASGTRLSTTTDANQATLFAVSGSASSLTIKTGNYYLSHSTSGVSLSTSSSNASWKFDGNRFYFTQSTRSWYSTKSTNYYLRYSNGFSVSTSSSAYAGAYSVTEGTPEIPGSAYTEITVAGTAPGTTYAVVGDTLYTITVTKAPSTQFITVHTVDDAGVTLKEDYVISGKSGTGYTVTAPYLAGYTAPKTVTGTYTDAETGEITLVYTLNTDKSALAKALETLYAPDDYTPASYETYNIAYLTAYMVYEEARSAQTEVDEALANLRNAEKGLKKLTFTVTVNYVDDLGAKIAESETKTGEIGTSYRFTPSVIAGYTAPAVVSGTFTEDTTFTAVYTLSTDKSALAALLNGIVEQGEYTDESYRTYLSAVEAGQSVYNNSRALQADVDNAVKAINTAKNALAAPSEVSFVRDTDGVNSGAEYVIVYNGKALAMVNNNLTAVDVAVQNDGLNQADDNAVWIITKSGSSYTIRNKATGRYLTTASSGGWFSRTYNLSSTTSRTAWTISTSGTNVRLNKSGWYVSYSNGFGLTSGSSSSTNMALYMHK